MNKIGFIRKLNNPQIFLGKEINSVHKIFKQSNLNICLIYPDTYEIGMSHYGLKILYHFLNSYNNVHAQRALLPNKENIKIFEENQVKLFSLENKIDLKDFDIISFSLLTELNFTNILKTLELGGIEIFSEKRDNNSPLIMTGGISAINPEPLRNFIDFFAFGDGEVLFKDILNKLIPLKKNNKFNKESSLEIISQVKGIYIPKNYTLTKKSLFYIPQIKSKIRKRALNSIDKSQINDVIVPITNVVFDRLDVEIARGCPQNCRFCQAKSYYSPYREKDSNKIKKQIIKSLNSTGFESFSLTSLSAGDYSKMNKLLNFIIDNISHCTSFSVPSLRPSTLSEKLLKSISEFRKTGITIVPEAGSERLRRVINKNIEEKDILDAIKRALDFNWQRLKFYFMIGLPTETYEDLDEIVNLIEKVLDISKQMKKRVILHLSFSSFVPKPHTPFQWEKRIDDEEIEKRKDYLFDKLKRYRNVKLDFHNTFRAKIETILSRGDKEVGKLIYNAFKQGQTFSAWDDKFDEDTWKELLNEFDYKKYINEIPIDQELPWEFIIINYNKEFLLNERKNAYNEIKIPSCNDMDCSECKGCYFGKRELKESEQFNYKINNKETEYKRILIIYEKKGDSTYLSNINLVKYIERIIRKTGIKFKCTEGFHPRLKLSTPSPLPVFATGLNEIIEIHIEKDIDNVDFLNLLNKSSSLIKFKKVIDLNQEKKLSKLINHIEYEIKIILNKEHLEDLNNILINDDELVIKQKSIILKIKNSQNPDSRFSKIKNILLKDSSSPIRRIEFRLKE